MGVDNSFLTSSNDIDDKNMITSLSEFSIFMDNFGTNLQELPDWLCKLASGEHSLIMDAQVGYDKMKLSWQKNEVKTSSTASLGPKNLTSSEEEIKEYLSILKPSRSDNRDYWRNVLWSLASADPDINNEDSKFLALADWFSQKSSKYKNLKDVMKIYQEYKPHAEKKIGLGTLIEYAKQDNPEEYAKISAKYHHTLRPDPTVGIPLKVLKGFVTETKESIGALPSDAKLQIYDEAGRVATRESLLSPSNSEFHFGNIFAMDRRRSIHILIAIQYGSRKRHVCP